MSLARLSASGTADWQNVFEIDAKGVREVATETCRSGLLRELTHFSSRAASARFAAGAQYSHMNARD